MHETFESTIASIRSLAKMSNPTSIVELPANQKTIRDRCVHPSGTFVEFLKEETEQSIPARFEKIVRLYPRRLAIKAKDASFTYEELNDQVSRIAHSILAAVGTGNRPVAILMKHGASIVAAILGALKAGKIYVPLDPAYPVERLRYILQDANPELILTQPETDALAASIREGKLQTVDVEHLSACIANDGVGVHVPPSAFAYILYTSGSTGQPKGVVDNHRNVLHGTLRFTNPQHIGAEDRISLTHSCSSSASVRRIFPALLNGAALFPLDIKEGGLQGLGKFLNEESITIFGSGRIRDVVRSFDRSQTFPNLRLVSFGGEVVYRRDVDLYRKIFGPDCVFGIWMSSTEAGNITQFLIADEGQLTGDIVPAGYPATDVEVMVLDGTGAKLEADEIGEIAVRSPYLSCGYWRRPELTNEKFQLDPDGGERRIYRTGDVGRLTLDGCLFHLGRRDDQVKIRGYRVEIAEIQASILTMGLFAKAFVTTRDQQSGDKSLVAYLVPENWPAPTTSALRKALATLLPSHMIPSVFILIQALPQTPNGKVARGAFPEPDHSLPNLETLFVAPNSDTEKKIAEIWSDVLDIVPVGTDDNFFDLGGHSLLAAKLFARLDQAFGRVFPLSVLLEAPTIRALAARYEAPEIRQKNSVLVALQCSGTLPPVYAVPGVFGDAVSYANLSRELGAEQPFFGFNAIGLDAAEAPLESIEEIARRNVSEIRSVHRNGPFALIGACFGAAVAYEMARQLTEVGEEVAFLGLLDPL